MIQMKIAAVMMVPLTFCGFAACAQEPQPNCVATATVPSQLKPQTSSPFLPQEHYGPYVPYTGPPLAATPPQTGTTDVTPTACSAASAQTPAPSAQLPPPPPPKLQEEVVYGSYAPYTAPAPKAAPPQVAVNEVPPAPCSTASAQQPAPTPTLKLQDDPVYASYVPYTGPPVKTTPPPVEVASAAPPTSCFTPEAQSLHSSSAPAAAPLQLVSSEPESKSEAPHDPPPSGAARPPLDDTPINPSPIVGEPASTSEFVRLAPPPLSAEEPYQLRPFRSVAIGFKAGSLGTGIELATPASYRFNLRSSINIFAFDYPFTIDGINYNARLHLKSSATTLDWFPLGRSFHVSPGILYVKNTLSAPASVGPGQTFVLGTQTFVNSIDDPMSGSASVIYPHSYAPMLLLGFGNLIPRSGRHLSFPIEFGAAYTGAPQISVALTGTACVTDGCVSFGASAPAQTFVKQEVHVLNEDLKRYPVFPIVSIGMSYHF
jgi:hypothetical protein